MVLTSAETTEFARLRRGTKKGGGTGLSATAMSRFRSLALKKGRGAPRARATKVSIPKDKGGSRAFNPGAVPKRIRNISGPDQVVAVRAVDSALRVLSRKGTSKEKLKLRAQFGPTKESRQSFRAQVTKIRQAERKKRRGKTVSSKEIDRFFAGL